MYPNTGPGKSKLHPRRRDSRVRRRGQAAIPRFRSSMISLSFLPFIASFSTFAIAVESKDPSVVSNMVDLNANRTPIIISTVTVLWALSLVAIGARLLGRVFGHTRLWWDDWLILVAAVLQIPAGTADLLKAHFGAGKHLQSVIEQHPGNIVKFLKAVYAGDILYPPMVVCIKCSILSLYYRLFHVNKRFARACQALIGVTLSWGVATLTPAVFQCAPIKKEWDPTDARRSCIGVRPYVNGTNVVNVLLDCVILVMPIYIIWELKLPTARKLLISGIFILGACETAFSITRLVTLTDLDSSDATWDYLTPIIWSAVETSVGIICACLPVMAPLIPKLFRRRLSNKESHSTSSFRLSAMPRKTEKASEQRFERLDDTTPLVSEGGFPMNIIQTTDITIQEERKSGSHGDALEHPG